jgi:hypothetical protein
VDGKPETEKVNGVSTNKNNDGCKPETDADHSDSELFERVASILDHARGNVVKAINNQMAIAYWLIGREIVQALQGGEGRAEYGKQVIENLSKQLTKRYGKGFSATNLKYFRTFYLAYPDRLATIRHPLGDELPAPQKGHPENDELMQGFSPRLSWSHYRALMQVGKPDARQFYEREAIDCGWDKRTLERQIHSFYYERLLKSQNPQKMLQSARKELAFHSPAIETLKILMFSNFWDFPMWRPCTKRNWNPPSLPICNPFFWSLEKVLPLSPVKSGCDSRIPTSMSTLFSIIVLSNATC